MSSWHDWCCAVCPQCQQCHAVPAMTSVSSLENASCSQICWTTPRCSHTVIDLSFYKSWIQVIKTFWPWKCQTLDFLFNILHSYFWKRTSMTTLQGLSFCLQSKNTLIQNSAVVLLFFPLSVFYVSTVWSSPFNKRPEVTFLVSFPIGMLYLCFTGFIITVWGVERM